MGELIRNLHPIKLGDEELMIELNEGYHKHQGRVIHIQNKKFRFLMREKSFLQLATTVLRAKTEMDFYKNAMAVELEQKEAPVSSPAKPSDISALKSFASILNSKGISYRLIETGLGYATLIVENTCRKNFKKLMKSTSGVKKSVHIYSKKMGYSFLYQMKEFSLYSYEGTLFEIYYQLPCLSLTPKTWVPLDLCVQKRIFTNDTVDADGIHLLDDISLYIYRLCWAVFVNNAFSAKDKDLLTKKAAVLKDEAFKPCLDKVFFGYTPVLIEKLSDGAFDTIVPDYFRFMEY